MFYVATCEACGATGECLDKIEDGHVRTVCAEEDTCRQMIHLIDDGWDDVETYDLGGISACQEKARLAPGQECDVCGEVFHLADCPKKGD